MGEQWDADPPACGCQSGSSKAVCQVETCVYICMYMHAHRLMGCVLSVGWLGWLLKRGAGAAEQDKQMTRAAWAADHSSSVGLNRAAGLCLESRPATPSVVDQSGGVWFDCPGVSVAPPRPVPLPGLCA